MKTVITCMRCQFAFSADVSKDVYICPSCGTVMVRVDGVFEVKSEVKDEV